MNNDLISRSALLAALVEGGILPAMVRRTIENAPAVDAATVRWIPVTERLPDTFHPVIVCREREKDEYVVEQGFKDVGDWWKVYGTRTKKVTHWMPLPEPPEAEAVLEAQKGGEG